MRLFQRLILLSAALIVASCATQRPQLTEVGMPPERIIENGYSLMPLNEEGWMYGPRSLSNFSLMKEGGNPDESIVIQGILSKLDNFNSDAEFVQLIEKEQAKDTPSQRFKTLRHEITSFPMNEVVCAKSYMVAEDNAASRRSGNTGIMILEMLLLSCAHPSEKMVGVNVVYSHRYYPGDKDPAFIEKGMSILNSVELFEPEQPYISAAQKSNIASAKNFVSFCSEIMERPSVTQAQATQETDAKYLEQLASIGVSIGRQSSRNQIGIYALFEKGEDGFYSLIKAQPSYIDSVDVEKQEELYVSSDLSFIAPAFTRQVYIESKQAFRCASGTKYVTGIDTSFRDEYNPCDSSLTSASNIGSAVVANTLLTALSLGTNLVSGSSVTFVDTNKDKVAELVVNSKLLQCLKEANSS